jgi:glyceraldehyde-3-phosphate dehydrogenase (NADP+)
VLATNLGRINVNTQCGRSPDVLPFSGRKSSALGTMSVSEALRAFSIETVVAGKHSSGNAALMRGADSFSNFLASMSDDSAAAAAAVPVVLGNKENEL